MKSFALTLSCFFFILCPAILPAQTNFGPQQVLSAKIPFDFNAHAIVTGDFDNDGDDDIVCGGDPATFLVENLGNGKFDTAIQLSSQQSKDLDIYDIDGDGDLDILASTDRFIGYYKNDGNGNFPDFEELSSGIHNATYGIDTLDFDGDGLFDVYGGVVDGLDDSTKWYKNLGNGNFTVGGVIDSRKAIYHPKAVDYDQDGDIDLTYIIQAIDDWVAIKNYQSSGYQATQQALYPNSHFDRDAQDLKVRDIDGDNDMDLVACYDNPEGILWFENFNGSFDQDSTRTIASGKRHSIQVMDIDSDGDLDVVSASNDENKIALHINKGNGKFETEQVISTIANRAIVVALSDLDNDGDLDILSGSSDDQKLAWYKNLTNENLCDSLTLNVQNVDTAGAELAWSGNSIDSVHFQVVERDNGIGNEAIAMGASTQSPVSFTGLQGKADYDVYAKGFCSNKPDYTWQGPIQFSTPPPPDNEAPFLTNVYPDSGAAHIAPDFNAVRLYFREPVKKGSGKLEIKKSSNDQVAFTKSAAGLLRITDKQYRAQLGNTTLEGSTQYYITIERGFLADTAGNKMEAVTKADNWTFTTDAQTGVLNAEKAEFEIYPNPANEQILIEGIKKTVQYTIYSSRMKTIQKGKTNNKVNIKSLDPGMYILIINTEEALYKHQFITH